MIIKDIHIGDVILSRVQELGMPKLKFAELLGIARQNVNKTIFDKQSLDTALLSQICEVLDYNFFALYTDCNTDILQEEKEVKATATIIIEKGNERYEYTLTNYQK